MLALWGLCAALSVAGCQPESGPAGLTNSAAPTADDSRSAPTLDIAKLHQPLTIAPLAWVQQTKLVSSDGSTGTSFGRAVAVTGDTAVIGAWFASPSGLAQAGTAYVFVRSGTVWTQQAQLNASDVASTAYFGYSVAIANDSIVIGSVGASSFAGKAYVFTRSGTTWTEQAKLVASDTAASASFGDSVALVGDTAIIGAPRTKVAGLVQAGQAYVFTRSGTSWTEQAKLVASDKVVAGAFGEAVALEGNTAIIGASGVALATGQAYVFVGSGASWSEQAKLLASDRERDANFGSAVALSGDTIVVGASGMSLGTGAAYVFTRSGISWAQQAKLEASDGDAC